MDDEQVLFLVVESNGGPFDDEAYAAGWEAAQIDHLLMLARTCNASSVNTGDSVLRAENLPQVQLLAMMRGFDVDASEVDGGYMLGFRALDG